MSSRSQPYGIGFFDWFGRRSFRNQLILLVLATALPLLGISALMFRELVGIGRESLRRDLMVSAKTVVGILDRNRRFVARVPDSEARLGTVASEGWRKAIDAASEGWTETATVEGDLATTAYAPTRQGWIVGVAQLQAQTNAPFQSVLRFTALGSAGLLLLSGALAFMVAWHTSRGVTMLARSARQLASGKAFEAPPAPFAEAVEIGSTLVFVSDELQKHEAALARGRMELEAELARRSQALEAEGRRRAAIEDQLRQSQKMEALGQLTGGVAQGTGLGLSQVFGFAQQSG